MTYALREHEDILRRLTRMAEYTALNPSSLGIPGSKYDMGMNLFSRELAMAQTYQPNSIDAAVLKASKGYQIPGTDSANLVDSLKGKSFSYTPKGTYHSDGASLVYGNNSKGTYSIANGIYGAKAGKGSYSAGGKGSAYSGGGKGSGSSGSLGSSGSGGSGGSGGGSGGGGS